MPATYNIEGHVLLSTAAAALDPAVLDMYAMAAERQLRLHRTAFTGDDAADATTAVVRQVNRILEWERYQGVVSISKAGQSQTFQKGSSAPIDRVAAAIAEDLNGSGRRSHAVQTIPTT